MRLGRGPIEHLAQRANEHEQRKDADKSAENDDDLDGIEAGGALPQAAGQLGAGRLGAGREAASAFA